MTTNDDPRVEAAARAYLEAAPDTGPGSWDRASEAIRARMLKRQRAALAAADAATPARPPEIHLSDPQQGLSFCDEPATVITEAGDTRPVCQACHRGAMKHVAAASPARTLPSPDPDGGVLTGPETAAMGAAGRGETMPDWLDQIEARARAATDGPWGWHQYMNTGRTLATPGPVFEHKIAGRVRTFPTHELNVLKTTDDWPPTDADAEFIAHARQDVPALVAALRAVLDLADLADRQKRTSFPDRMKPEVFAELNTRDIRAAIKEALS